MSKSRYTVSYMVKAKEDRLIIDKRSSFSNLSEAISFLRNLQSNRVNLSLVGSPILETK